MRQKIPVQHEMLSSQNQRRRGPILRKKRSKVSSLPAVVFWSFASLLCLSILCWISYHVSSAEQKEAAIHVPSLRRVPTEDNTRVVPSTLVDMGWNLKQTQVECTITTPHSTNINKSELANGTFQITVQNDLAPKASWAFLHLVRSNYYSGTYFHRVVKNFVAQVGIDSNYHVMRPPAPKNMIPDPVKRSSLSNVRGTVSFAGGNMQLGQIFINLGDNQRLDGENHADGSTRPFGVVSPEDMSELIDKIFTGYKEGSGQVKAVKNGEVATQFPEMSRIEECHVLYK